MGTIKRVTGLMRHDPWQTRIHLRRRARPRIGSLVLCAVVLGPLVGASGAAAAAGVNVTGVEGQALTGNVVSGLVCPLASATISWGDGTVSAGTSDGSSAIQGTHTYAAEGTYAGSVSYTYSPGGVLSCPSGAQTASFQATVGDAPLASSGHNLTGTARVAVSGVVAHFSDANPGAEVGDFTAQIDWGDGSTTAGTVVAGQSGGFDVTGAHTYAAAGTFALAVNVTDVGGSTTTAATTAAITAPRLPPPFNIVIPRAVFAFSPLSPCQSQQVVFDASASAGGDSPTGPLPITQYRWSFDESAFAPTVVLTTGASVIHAFLPSSYGPGPYGGSGPNPRGDLFDYRFYRPPAMVTLEVTDSAGKSASVTQRITFHDPVRTVPEIVPIDPQTGVPDFSHPHVNRNDPRFKHATPCAKRHIFKLVGSAKLKLGRITLRKAYVTIKSSGIRGGFPVSLTVKSRCRPGPVGCFGDLIVLDPTHPSRHGKIATEPLRGSLGHMTFFAAAGHTTTVIVKLNARGRALVRTHRLSAVTLELRSFGTAGKLVTASRTVRLR